MAHSHNNDHNALAVLLVSLVLTTAYPLAQAQTELTRISITGRLCCSVYGNCRIGARPLPEVPITVNCTNRLGVSTKVGQGTTNLMGRFDITAPLPTPFSFSPFSGGIPCTVTTVLPLSTNACPLLSSTATGILRGVLLPDLGEALIGPVVGRTTLDSIVLEWIRVGA